ncbi:MAG: hypothetical protein HY070_06480 [Chloroflexi bacterium]|nr:hypothetical protein [Chloroflexota bacterium]MBI3742556.1 hypothetical protein [Chloroflexota bacterium]
MDTIKLNADLVETLERVAQQQASSVTDLVNQAVGNYLRQQQRAKLDQEIAAYEKMHPRLKKENLGEWVAVHQQALVDHDQDLSALYRRVRAQYGKTSILIRQVSGTAVEEVWLRTPSEGKITT